MRTRWGGLTNKSKYVVLPFKDNVATAISMLVEFSTNWKTILFSSVSFSNEKDIISQIFQLVLPNFGTFLVCKV